MVNQLQSAVVKNTYANSLTEQKDLKQKSSVGVSKQGDMSKVEQLRESVNSGEYKVDLKALSEKIAQELL